MTLEVTADPLPTLRTRTSEKWTSYPDDVLPLFVAEMDFPLAPVVRDALLARVQASDTGYVGAAGDAGTAFAGFAERRWGWTVDPGDIGITTDVSVAIVETLRVAIAPGDGVIIMPPVYPPFFDLVPEAGGRVVEVPLLSTPDAEVGALWAIDLDGVEAALAAGARGVLLCNPHNPLGLVHDRETLARLADLAAEHGAVVVSDEIHAPLTHAGVTFTPFLSVSDAAREVGIATPSGSKAFNLAGVKCALLVAASDRGRALLHRMPEEVTWRASILGRAATAAGFALGDEWLDGALRAIEGNLARLRHRLPEVLPGAEVHVPRASYLAWIDFRRAGLGDEPAARILEDARVALNRGLDFGAPGAGFARLNLACGPEVLDEALDRIGRLR